MNGSLTDGEIGRQVTPSDVPATLKGKRVFVTGHTGFKGAWLTGLLHSVGAEVHGYSLEPLPEAQTLFQSIGDKLSVDQRGDVRCLDRLRRAVKNARPQFVLHLAAQPLVLASYSDPLLTFETNVMGTTNLLESVRLEAPDATTIVVTTDKVYANDEMGRPFEETDRLGGRDPYSSSKAASEMVAFSYDRSFFEGKSCTGTIATARGGNVIGGGDYAKDRLVPDIIRALSAGREVEVRNPGSIRPWQHVLDCLWGYLTLATWLHACPESNRKYRAFNFGPDPDAFRPVRDLVSVALTHWSGKSVPFQPTGEPPHEASSLRLDTSRSESILGWKPTWNFDSSLRLTIEWYKKVESGEKSARSQVETQIRQFLTETLTASPLR